MKKAAWWLRKASYWYLGMLAVDILQDKDLQGDHFLLGLWKMNQNCVAPICKVYMPWYGHLTMIPESNLASKKYPA